MNPGTGRQFHTLAHGVGEIDFPWGVGKVGDVAHMGAWACFSVQVSKYHLKIDPRSGIVGSKYKDFVVIIL